MDFVANFDFFSYCIGFLCSIDMTYVWFVMLLDEYEVENGSDDDLLHSIEANDSRGGTTPMSGSAMTPSPILLWRFKVFFLLALF